MFTVGACSGDVAVLTEAQGELGTVGRTYGNNEKCQWRIEIESGQVGCFFLNVIIGTQNYST